MLRLTPHDTHTQPPSREPKDPATGQPSMLPKYWWQFLLLAVGIQPVVTLCSPGQYLAGTSCRECLPGKYQGFNSSNATHCLSCGANTYSTCPMSSSCTPCPAGFETDTAHTECVFPSRPPLVAMQYRNNRLCYDVTEQTATTTTMASVKNSGFRLFFMEKTRQGINGVDSSMFFDFHRASCTATRMFEKSKKFFASSWSVHCPSNTVAEICFVTERPIRKIVVSTENRATQMMNGTTFLGKQTWTASPWVVDHDCDDLRYLDDTSVDPTEWHCVGCPDHASCERNANWQEVTALFGNTRLSRKDACTSDGCSEDRSTKRDTFQPCVHPPACLGSKNSEFADVYPEEANETRQENCNTALGFRNVSRGCRACLPNYFPSSNVACTKCPEPIWNAITTLFAAIACIFFISFFLNKSLADSERLSTKIDTTYSNLAQSMEKIMISHAQVLGVMGNFPLRWPEYLRQFFWIFSLFSNPAAYLFNPACYSIQSNGTADGSISPFMLKQLLVLVSPMLLLIPLTCFWYARYVVSKIFQKKNNTTVEEGLEIGKKAGKKEKKKRNQVFGYWSLESQSTRKIISNSGYTSSRIDHTQPVYAFDSTARR